MQLQVSIAGERYQQELISCQVACPVHTDARGYVRAIAEGRFEEAYLIARGPNPFASICGRIDRIHRLSKDEGSLCAGLW